MSLEKISNEKTIQYWNRYEELKRRFLDQGAIIQNPDMELSLDDLKQFVVRTNKFIEDFKQWRQEVVNSLLVGDIE